MTPAGAQLATLLDTEGQGAGAAGLAHWLPRGPCKPQGDAVGEYGGEEYGEPPAGCTGNMERI